jgi:hypothetical protein
LTDALGNRVHVVLLPGYRFDTIGVAPLIKGIGFDALWADKAFVANWIIAEMNQRGAEIVNSQRPQRIAPLDIDADSSRISSPSAKNSKASPCGPKSRPQGQRHDLGLRCDHQRALKLNRAKATHSLYPARACGIFKLLLPVLAALSTLCGDERPHKILGKASAMVRGLAPGGEPKCARSSR